MLQINPKPTKINLLFFFLLGVFGPSFLYSQDRPIEEGWKGIKVFESTRSDVERAFGGEGEQIVEGRMSYRIGKRTQINFGYSHERCSNRGNGRFDLPKDTVIEYEVFLQDGIDIDKFQWNKELYEVYEDEHILGQTWYYSPKSGIRITTSRKKTEDNWVETVGIIRFERTGEQNTECVCDKYK